jgi:O-antigen/teichoic acid export membrane protein
MSASSLATTSLARLNAHVRTPLFRNGYALLLSSALTSGLGMVYWIVAARAYTTEAVGLNSAVIAAMTLLAGVAQLNLMSALVRFIPGAGPATGRLVVSAYLIAMLMAVVVSLTFIGGLDTWAPALAFLRSSPLFILWFTLATMAWCIFVLQDNVLTGLRQAVWVPVENTAFAVAKIALLLVFAGGVPHYGVFASWTLPVGALLVATNALIFRRLIPKHVQATQDQSVPLKPTQVVKYVAVDYLGYLCTLASGTLLPLIVTREAGATANAYYFLSWQIAYALYLISPNMGASLVVEAAKDPAKLGTYSYRVFVQTARVVVPLAAIMALGAPAILRIFGDNYAQEGAMPLRLLALSAIPHLVNSLYISIVRVQRRMTAVVTTLASLCTLVLVLSFVLLPQYGITGVGTACLVGQSIVAVVVLLTQLRPLWFSDRAGEGPDQGSRKD